MKVFSFLVLLFCLAGATPGTTAAERAMTFFVRIHPTRANFLTTTTNEERARLSEHFEYWKARMAEHKLILAGPVPIETGTFGILIVRAQDMHEAERLINADPSVAHHVNAYEIYPLRLSLYEGMGSQ
ncbi:MAG TPA: YciI family protein [Candidatus Cybelea sp.]|jgi:uncharacterized protein YciI|nr:YciI family protein [Candidatus Cybelea sp.]